MTNVDLSIEFVKKYQECRKSGVSEASAVLAVLHDLADYKDKQLIDKACEYWSQRISINKEIETNEDGQPYADSYFNWLAERDKVVKEILSDFRKEMEV